MTNKIEISRDLAERLTKDYTGRPNWDALEEDRLAATEELRALLTAPAVERQEECKCSSGMAIVSWLHSSYCPVFKSLDMDSHPAPAAVVLPDRGGISNRPNFNEGWNACLDKVKEMNK